MVPRPRKRREARATQTVPRDGGRKVDCVKDGASESGGEEPNEEARVPQAAKHALSNPAGAGPSPGPESRTWEGVDREIWSERMLAALVTASKQGKEPKIELPKSR